MRERIDSFFSRYRKIMAECYKEGVEKGEFRDDISPEQAALIILSSINGIGVLTKVQRNAQIAKEAGQTLLSLLSIED
jgi:hypothetical protein